MEIVKAYLPADLVTKAKGSNEENNKMIISGVASTTDRDMDGEILDPNGMELDYFIKKGHINYDHLGHYDPSAIIGYPIAAEIKDDKLFIKAELYKDNDIAVKAFNLMKAMETQKAPRSLGFSIEAHVISRREDDKKYIEKSMITDIALTPCPKNFKTNAMVVKSFSSIEEAEKHSFNEDTVDWDEEFGGLLKKSIEAERDDIDKRIDAIIDLADAVSCGEIQDDELKTITNTISGDADLMSKLDEELKQ